MNIIEHINVPITTPVSTRTANNLFFHTLRNTTGKSKSLIYKFLQKNITSIISNNILSIKAVPIQSGTTLLFLITQINIINNKSFDL